MYKFTTANLEFIAVKIYHIEITMVECSKYEFTVVYFEFFTVVNFYFFTVVIMEFSFL